MQMDNSILYEKIGHVGIIRLNNPPMNLQTLSSMHLLGEICEKLEEDMDICSVLLTTNGGKIFCAGSDVKEFPALRGNFVEEKLRYENYVFDTLAQLPMPTVAAITGSALGGGFEMALCCDFRVMNEGAFLSMPEINLGNFPGSGGIMRLCALKGPAFAMEFASLSRRMTAQECLRHGLVSAICPAEEVETTALALAESLAQKPSAYMRGVKELVKSAWFEKPSEATQHSIKVAKTQVYRRIIDE